MARRVAQHLDYDDAGSSTFYVPGHVDSVDFDNDGAIEWETAMGGVATQAYGVVVPSGSVTFRPVDATFLNKCLRASFTCKPSPLILRVGGSSEAYTHNYAYCQSLSIKGSVGTHLSATMSWLAITPDAIVVPTWTAYSTGNPFAWHQGVCTINDANLSMQDFSIDLSHNLQAHTSLDTATTASQRIAEEITAHNMELSFTATVHVPPGTSAIENWSDAASVASTASLVFTSATPTTLTIALSNLGLKSWKWTGTKSDGVASWALNFVGKPNATNLAISV